MLGASTALRGLISSPLGNRFGSQPPRLDLVLVEGQRFGSQSWIAPRYRSCSAADGVIPQL